MCTKFVQVFEICASICLFNYLIWLTCTYVCFALHACMYMCIAYVHVSMIACVCIACLRIPVHVCVHNYVCACTCTCMYYECAHMYMNTPCVLMWRVRVD